MAIGVRADHHTRFRLVDSMRGLAALSVVYFHVSFRFPFPHSGLSQYLSQREAGPPITAVVLFFLISGFVLYRPFVAARVNGQPLPPLVPYAVRRFARIVPAYWVALAIISVWLAYSYIATPQGIVRYFGFLQLYGDLTTAGGGINVAWSLCVEVTFYALLPLLAILVRRLGRQRSLIGSELVMCASMVAVSLAWQVAITSTVQRTNGFLVPLLWMLPGSLDLFAAGMVLAVASVYYQRHPSPGQRAWAVWMCWLPALGILWGEEKIPGSVGLTGWWIATHTLKLLACGLLLAPLVIGPQEKGLLRRVLGAGPVVWLGLISYGIYLWHYALLMKLAPRLTPHGELYTTVVIALLSVALGAISYYLVERPAQRMARRLIARRARSVAVIAPAAGLLTAGPVPPADSP